TPIWLLYRILLGSAFANNGACASVVISHKVAEGVELRIVGNIVAGEGDGDGVGEGAGLVPYRLKFVVKFKLAEIQVLVVSLLPCKYEYGYQVPFGDW